MSLGYMQVNRGGLCSLARLNQSTYTYILCAIYGAKKTIIAVRSVKGFYVTAITVNLYLVHHYKCAIFFQKMLLVERHHGVLWSF